MTIDRASVEHGARLATEATQGPWTYDEVLDPDDGEWRWIEPSLTIDPESSALSKPNAAFIAHWNPEFAAELARELQRLWRVEEEAERLIASHRHFQPNDACQRYRAALEQIASGQKVYAEGSLRNNVVAYRNDEPVAAIQTGTEITAAEIARAALANPAADG